MELMGQNKPPFLFEPRRDGITETVVAEWQYASPTFGSIGSGSVAIRGRGSHTLTTMPTRNISNIAIKFTFRSE